MPEWAVRTVLQAALPDEAVDATGMAGTPAPVSPFAQDPQSRLERTLAGETIAVMVMRDATVAIDTWVAEHLSSPADAAGSTSETDFVADPEPTSDVAAAGADSMWDLAGSAPESPSTPEPRTAGAETGHADQTDHRVEESDSAAAASSAQWDADRPGNPQRGSLPGDELSDDGAWDQGTAVGSATRPLPDHADPMADGSTWAAQDEAVPIGEDQGEQDVEAESPIWFSGTAASAEADLPVVSDPDQGGGRDDSSGWQGGESWAAPAFDASWADSLPVQDEPTDTDQTDNPDTAWADSLPVQDEPTDTDQTPDAATPTWQPPTTATAWADSLPVHDEPTDTDEGRTSPLGRQAGQDEGDRAWPSEPVGIFAGAADDLAGHGAEPTDPIGAFAAAAEEMATPDDDGEPSTEPSADFGLWIPTPRASYGLDGDANWDDRDEEQELPEPSWAGQGEQEESAEPSWYDEEPEPVQSQVWSLDEVVPGPRDSQDEPAAQDQRDD